MLRIHTTAAIAVGLIGSILLGGSPSVGEEPPIDGERPPTTPTTSPVDLAAPTASVSPTGGPAGSVVTLSGTGCLAGGKEPGLLNFGFTRTEDGVLIDLSGLDGYPANDDGTWSFDTSIPTRLRTPDGALVDVEPGPHYELRAACIFNDRPDLWIFYPALAFEVTGAHTLRPSPETAAPGVTPGASSSSNPATASTPLPATPVEDDPPFTG